MTASCGSDGQVDFFAGFRAELMPEELEILHALEKLPSIRNELDRLSSLEMIRAIAHSRAIVAPDSAAICPANSSRPPPENRL